MTTSTPKSPLGGRPAVGPAISVAYPRELLDRINAAAEDAGQSRAEWLRRAAEAALRSRRLRARRDRSAVSLRPAPDAEPP